MACPCLSLKHVSRLVKITAMSGSAFIAARRLNKRLDYNSDVFRHGVSDFPEPVPRNMAKCDKRWKMFVTVCASVPEEISACIYGVEDEGEIEKAFNQYLFQAGFVFVGDYKATIERESYSGNDAQYAYVTCVVRRVLQYVGIE